MTAAVWDKGRKILGFQTGECVPWIFCSTAPEVLQESSFEIKLFSRSCFEGHIEF